MKNILWIEDELSGLSSLTTLLIEKGYQLDNTDNAHEALEFINRIKYDLIILDFIIYHVPRRPEFIINDSFENKSDFVGFELITKIIEQDFPLDKIIILSKLSKTYIQKELKKRGISLDNNIITIKDSFDVDDFLNLIENHI